ncbi:hypothetical protein [uncultured Paracoccus sp.]|nr:hypothetical protein [uncultured Paracoccus sp.]
MVEAQLSDGGDEAMAIITSVVNSETGRKVITGTAETGTAVEQAGFRIGQNVWGDDNGRYRIGLMLMADVVPTIEQRFRLMKLLGQQLGLDIWGQ